MQPEQQHNAQEHISQSHWSKQTKMIIGVAVIALVALAAGLFVYLNRDSAGNDVSLTPVETSQTPVTTLGAALATIEGNVETSSDSANWQAGEAGQSLANLDYIRTGSDGRAIILFDNGSIARLNNDTTVYLSSLQPEGIEITLQNGEVYSRVVESESQTFSVLTANERFEALGTAYTTTVDENTEKVDVYQSKVKVVSADIEVAEGNSYDSESKESQAIDLEALSKDKFAQWNKEKDSDIDEFKDKLGVLNKEITKDESENQPTPQQSSNARITLRGVQADGGVQLNWSMKDISATKGFKVVRDKYSARPTYGTHSAIYVGSSSARQTRWYDDNGGSYFYRVCIYTGDSCTNYSNAVKVASPKIQKESITSGNINLAINGNQLSWNLAGGTAPHGFKVVLSTTQNPTYPANSIQYTDKMTATLPEKPDGTYYVRVCKYTNGTQEAGCVDYSNQVEYVSNSSE